MCKNVYNVPIKLDTILQKDNLPDTVNTNRKAGIRKWARDNSQQNLRRS